MAPGSVNSKASMTNICVLCRGIRERKGERGETRVPKPARHPMSRLSCRVLFTHSLELVVQNDESRRLPSPNCITIVSSPIRKACDPRRGERVPLLFEIQPAKGVNESELLQLTIFTAERERPANQFLAPN